MVTPEEQYQQLLKIAGEDSGVVAFILAGGRGKGITTEHSDYNIFIVTEDAIVDGAKVKYQPFSGPAIDIIVIGRRAFSVYGVWGSDTMWARYNFAHVKALIDKDGETQKWLNTQELIPISSAEEAAKDALDNYLNYTHRSLKNFRDARGTAAHLAACDAIPYLITYIFAAEGRIRPYNEYIEWELNNHPLSGFPLKAEELNKKIGEVLGNGNQATQKELLELVRGIAGKSEKGAQVLSAWKEYYFGE